MIKTETKKPLAEGIKPLPVVVRAACDVLNLFQPDLLDTSDNSRKAVENRYMIYGLLEEAGYTHQQIADYFKINRENVTKALSKFEVWLEAYKDLAGSFQRLKLLALK